LDLDRLRELAGAFRDAIERADRYRLSVTLHNFPQGSCGEASMLLGTFLKNHGMGVFRYVCGRREGHSHSWIEADGVIVDITADQFPEISERLIVTRCSPWHGSFKREDDSLEANYHIWDPRTVLESARTYGVIMAKIEL
jgi:hypothetical protein